MHSPSPLVTSIQPRRVEARRWADEGGHDHRLGRKEDKSRAAFADYGGRVGRVSAGRQMSALRQMSARQFGATEVRGGRPRSLLAT